MVLYEHFNYLDCLPLIGVSSEGVSHIALADRYTHEPRVSQSKYIRRHMLKERLPLTTPLSLFALILILVLPQIALCKNFTKFMSKFPLALLVGTAKFREISRAGFFSPRQKNRTQQKIRNALIFSFGACAPKK